MANLRTIIVIADIHQGLQRPAMHLAAHHQHCLTFWHWSSVTPYTSSYEFAGSCVFDKQLPGRLSLRPRFAPGQALFRRYGRFFAEFLGDLSYVRLALLELTTCVGLRYGHNAFSANWRIRSFSWKPVLSHLPALRRRFSRFL